MFEAIGNERIKWSVPEGQGLSRQSVAPFAPARLMFSIAGHIESPSFDAGNCAVFPLRKLSSRLGAVCIGVQNQAVRKISRNRPASFRPQGR
jgi:hypothetical protein